MPYRAHRTNLSLSFCSNYARHAAELLPLQKQINQIDAKKSEYDNTIKTARTAFERHTRELQSLDDQHRTKIAAIAKANGDFEFAVTTNSERSKELEAANAVQLILVHDLKSAKELAGPDHERKAIVDEIHEKMNKLKGEMGALMQKRNHITSQLDEQIRPHMNSLQNKIQSAQSIGDRKLELLRNKYADAYRGTLWLRNNRHLFKGKVYEPMLLEVNWFLFNCLHQSRPHPL